MKRRLSQIILLFLVISSFLTFEVYSKEEKADIRIVSEIQQSGYEGQVFVNVVKLLSTEPDISDIRVSKAPLYPENVKRIKGVVRNSRPEQEKRNGKTYYSWTIGRDFLIPYSSGKFKIDKSRYVAFIPRITGYYSDFWGRHQVVDYEEVAVDCNAVEFKVNTLPENKTGKEFSEAVGNFNIEGWFPPGKITAGKVAYVIFKISGYGDLQNLRLPNISGIFREGCRLKEIEQQENQSQREGKLFSEVTLTCTFIPESDEFKIDPLCLLFFSPDTKKYEEKCSEILHWTSSPSKKNEDTSSKDAIAI